MCTTTAELDMHNELSLEAPCKIDALSKASLLVALLNVCLLDDYHIFTFYMYKNIYNLNIDLLVLLYSKHILLKLSMNKLDVYSNPPHHIKVLCIYSMCVCMRIEETKITMNI